MKRKFALAFITGILLLIVAFAFKTYSILDQRREAIIRLSDIPKINLIGIDSSGLEVDGRNKTLVIIYFNSSCDLCEFEAIDIRDNIKDFQNVNLLMLTSESLKSIQLFSSKFNLDKNENITFAKIDEKDVVTYFGSSGTPQIYIYRDEKLVKEFRGQTKVNVLKQFF